MINRTDLFTFTPPWWLRNCHLQSCFNTLFPPRSKKPIIWEELALPDGDFLDLCWAGPETDETIVLLHGLEGSVKSHYIQFMLDALTSAGFRVVVMHFRTCSGRLNRLARSYHAGETGDLGYCMEVLFSRFPKQTVSMIGFSLGANVLLHYLRENPDAPIHSAVAVSVPFELEQCVNYLSRFYQWKLLYSMKKKAMIKIKKGLDMPASAKEVKSIYTFRRFDNIVTAPLHGFCSAKDYYRQVSVRPFLNSIQHPTLIIHAIDDPLVPSVCVPTRKELSSSITLELFNRGGHVGFIEGQVPWRPHYWLKSRIMRFLEARRCHKKENSD